jgi:ABC-2 type transport system ATP-binding protein
MISLKNVTKTFKSEAFTPEFTALKELNFDIPEARITGFLGANGAGKTTSLKILMDFIRPTKGEVVYSNELGENRKEIFSNIGFLPERPYIYPHLTGGDFLNYMGSLVGLKKTRIQEQTQRWAPRLKIDFALNRKIKTYSKGMLQRIGFLATLLHDPKLIILDEPLSGLDPIGRKEIKDAIMEIYRDGRTIFFSSHIISDVEEVCHNVIFIKDGKLEYSGGINSLLEKYVSPDYIIRLTNDKNLNLSTPHKSVQLGTGDNLYLEVSDSDKNELLKELVSCEANILSVDKKKLNLEEVFYKGAR